MKKTAVWKCLAIVFISLTCLVSCGQKGDLYLPQGSQLIQWVG